MFKSILLPLALFSFSFGAPFYTNDNIEIKKGIAYTKQTNKRFDGIINELYETGELQSEKTYKYGIITDMKTYKISGALASQVIFKNGKATSGKIYYENPKKDRQMTRADFYKMKLDY